MFTLLFLCLALTFLMSDTMWVYRVCPQRDKRDKATSHTERLRELPHSPSTIATENTLFS